MKVRKVKFWNMLYLKNVFINTVLSFQSRKNWFCFICRCYKIICQTVSKCYKMFRNFINGHLIIFSLSLSMTELLRSTGSTISLGSLLWGMSPPPPPPLLRVEKSTGRDSSTNIPNEMSTVNKLYEQECTRAIYIEQQVPRSATAGE